MILVLCGTQKQDFTRMIKAVEAVADLDTVVVQAGHNAYHSDKMRVFSFVSNEEIQDLYEKADLIVTHGGAGSMLQAIQNKKKIIAFPRLSKYGEHVNDHQVELAKKYEDLGYLMVYPEGEDFKETYERAISFSPKPYELKGKIIELIDEKISSYFSK
ncbi:MAG: glycosyltransferase [Turicibacter sp.]